MSEKEYQEYYFRKITRAGQKGALEVSVLNRCVDVVFVDSNEEVVTVEFKLSNWRKALQQARDHQLYSHKSYICMPKPKRGFNPEFVSMANDYGIGIISSTRSRGGCRVNFEEELPARKNEKIWNAAFQKVEYALTNCYA